MSLSNFKWHQFFQLSGIKNNNIKACDFELLYECPLLPMKHLEWPIKLDHVVWEDMIPNYNINQGKQNVPVA